MFLPISSARLKQVAYSTSHIALTSSELKKYQDMPVISECAVAGLSCCMTVLVESDGPDMKSQW